MSFIICLLSGIATLLGLIPIFLKFKDIDLIISVSLSFTAGVMICVSILDLIPEGLKLFNSYFNGLTNFLVCFLFIAFGIYIFYFVNKCLNFKNKDYYNNDLYKIGLISMIAIIMHNIPEGIITFIASSSNLSLGLSLGLAIAIHNIPEGISISVPIYYSTLNRLKAFVYTFISSLSEIVGGLIAYFFLYKFINNFVVGLLFSFVCGIMLGITFNELIPNGFKNGFKVGFVSFFFGVIFFLIKFIL